MDQKNKFKSRRLLSYVVAVVVIFAAQLLGWEDEKAQYMVKTVSELSMWAIAAFGIEDAINATGLSKRFETIVFGLEEFEEDQEVKELEKFEK